MAFGIGGFNPLASVALNALMPGAGPLAQLGMQVFSRMAMQTIQQMGERLGLPQSQIDFAQSDFAFKAGDLARGSKNLSQGIEQLGRETGASIRDIADKQRESEDAIRDLVNRMAESQEAKEARASRGGKGSGSASAAGGWLRAMADVLGKKLDDLAHEMEDLANKVTKDDPSTTTDFNVVSQQFGMLMNATTTAIKTIGESLANSARKN